MEIKNTEDIKQGDKIELVYITENPLTSDTWIGLYHKGASTSNTSDGRISYGYVKDAKSYTDMWTGPSLAGYYEFRLISQKKLVFTLPFTVIPIDEREVELELLSDRILPSQDFQFKITTSLNLNRTSRIGSYTYSPKKSTSQSGYISSKFYYYRNSDDILTMTAPVKEGIYELRFHGPKSKIFIKRLVFLVGEPNLNGLSFALDKKQYKPGETVTVIYTGNEDLFERTWFGLFNAKEIKYSKRLAYRFIGDELKGTLTFEAPKAEGDYDVKWFYADQGPQLLEPQPFNVSSSDIEKETRKETLKKQLETDGKLIFYGIYFDFNKSNIRKESIPVVKEIADLLNANPDLVVSIDGHTDNLGTEHYNQKLSEQRAMSVIRMLEDQFWVEPGQLSYAGYGESRPIQTNDNEDGRAKNRRVEVTKR
ncbi:OmpA family protein [Ichthyenterobacterium sp. W332]|uniref:OmpA family protein n=1 Tax=Microcosmobacter mediterraneus TaxID=3075607 RepID=A0ABU2YI99_9FLAO|nr:OmpA family protein [Ichthyenterobacterium sp. W332]MDT0557757.1 OmpA family protein [Ichthyenterobacterium sp. W332]